MADGSIAAGYLFTQNKEREEKSMQKGFKVVNLHGTSSGVIAVPVIGENGNWWIGNEDTGIPVQGPQGASGPRGEKGDPGEQGPAGPQGPKGEAADPAVLGQLREEINKINDDLIQPFNSFTACNGFTIPLNNSFVLFGKVLFVDIEIRKTSGSIPVTEWAEAVKINAPFMVTTQNFIIGTAIGNNTFIRSLIENNTIRVESGGSSTVAARINGYTILL